MSFISEALNELERPEYEDDTIRIVNVAYSHGIIVSKRSAEFAWQKYSETMGAGWMNLPKSDDDLWDIIS